MREERAVGRVSVAIRRRTTGEGLASGMSTRIARERVPATKPRPAGGEDTSMPIDSTWINHLLVLRRQTVCFVPVESDRHHAKMYY